MSKSNRWLKSLRHRTEYVLFLSGMQVAKILTLKQCEMLANGLGSIAYDVLKIRRKIVQKNLGHTFPDKSPEEIDSLARMVYHRQALNIIEVLRISLIKDKADASKLLDIDGREFMEKTRGAGKGGVVVSAHFGNWELLGVCTGMLVTPMNIVIKKLKNPFIDARMNALRTKNGNNVIDKRNALRTGLDILKKGGVVTVLGDQSDPKAGFMTEFLGRRATAFLGPSFLALKAGVPIFIGMCRRQKNGRYLVEVEEVKSSDLSFCKEDVRELTKRYTRKIEQYIYRYPEEWFWMHDRWKRMEG